MAELPRYQSSGVLFSDVPSLDFVNVRESFKRSQSLSSSLDRLSEFAGKKALEERKKEAEEYTVNNPPTPEQLAKAKEGTFNPDELVPGGGGYFREAVRKLQGEQLKNVLNIETQNDYMQILNDVKERKIVSDEELRIKLEAPIIGRSKTIAKIDPEAALSYNALAAANGFQIRKAANEQFELNAKLEYDETTKQAVDSGLPLMREIVKQSGTSNPQAVKDQIEAIYAPIRRLAENGTPQAKQYLKEVEAELEGLAITGLDKTRSSAVRLAATGDKRAEAALSIAIKEMDDYAIAFDVNPKVREKYIADTIEDFHVARIQAEFAASPNKQGYLNSLRKDMTKGVIGELFDKDGNPIKTNRVSRGVEMPKLESIINGFEADLRAMRTEANALRAELKSDVTEANRILSLGSTVSPEEISSLSQRARRLGIPENDSVMQRINTLSILNNDTVSFKKMSPLQLRDVQRQWEKETAQGASLLQAERLNNIRSYTAAYEEKLKKDPVSAMSGSGIAVETLNFSAPDKDFVGQVQKRVTDAKVFASQNGIKPQFLSNDEANVVTTFLQSADTESQMAMLKKIQQSFGKDSYAVMAEISKTAPQYAHVAGLMSVGVNPNTVKEALIGIKHQQTGTKVEMTANVKKAVIDKTIGSAFSTMPQTRNNIINIADAIYTSRAIASGNTMTFDNNMYQKSLQEAAGGIPTRNGKDYFGGLYYNSSKNYYHMIPTNVTQNEFDDIIEKATFEDFEYAANGKLTDSKGRKYTADKLRDAYLMEDVNQDNMRLYYGNPSEAGSQQFYTQDGKPVVINYRKLVQRVKSK